MPAGAFDVTLSGLVGSFGFHEPEVLAMPSWQDQFLHTCSAPSGRPGLRHLAPVNDMPYWPAARRHRKAPRAAPLSLYQQQPAGGGYPPPQGGYQQQPQGAYQQPPPYQQPAPPAEAKSGVAEGCEETAEYQTEEGKTVMLCVDDEDKCIDSCKNAPELQDAPYDPNNKVGMLSNMAAGGEQQMQASCVRYCRLEFEIYCFPGDSTVFVRDRGSVPLAQLRVGDQILVLKRRARDQSGGQDCADEDAAEAWSLHFEPVLAWLHREPEAQVEVLRVRHACGEVHLSSNHLLFARRVSREGDPSKPGGESSAATAALAPVLAREVRVGDRLLCPWVDGTLAEPEVTAIDRVKKKGLHAPLLAGGTLLVDATAVSCYAIPLDIVADPTYAGLLRRFSAVLGRESIHELAHAVMLPLRAWYMQQRALPWAACCAPPLSTTVRRNAPPGEEKDAPPADDAVSLEPLPGIHPYGWFFYVLFKSLVA